MEPNSPESLDKSKNVFERYWDALKEHVWLRWVTGIAIFFIIGLIGSATEDKPTTPAAKTASADSAPAKQDNKTAAAPENETPAPAPKPKPLSQKQKVKNALNDIDGTVQDPVIKKVELGSDELTVTVATPEGGLEGASTRDLDEQAGAIFQAIYGPAGYKKTGSVVVFKGGLVDTKTGKDLNNVNTGIYSITKRDARQIDWADDDTVRYTIEWNNYRDFAHPALKQED